ncbi:MAG TPA: glycosyltransferase family 9 protein [Candidatus Nitrosopolaris sp.]|nr:glycosyltransferase family 9 protein [Candidatus Nitrosopolaris sp.]
MIASHPANFLARTRDAKKIMFYGLGFLGDMVHSLPALWMVRRAYPQAQLHVGIAAHVASFLECAPWVDRVWGYPRYPKHASLKENLDFVRQMRRERFDALISLNSSDRSGWLALFSGARERLGRVPKGGTTFFWRHRFTETVWHPYSPEPVYVQNCRCLAKVGFPPTPPEFHVEINAAHLQAARIAAIEAGTYFHLSPFTTDDRKELPPAQLVEFIKAAQARWPEKKWVLSCAPTERERGKMESLLKQLSRRPWRVFAGELNLMQLAAVIQHSAAHLCGDTGTLHLALMTGTPTVSWFRPNPGSEVWIPAGEQFRTLFGTGNNPHAALQGTETTELLAAVQAVLTIATPIQDP